MTSEASEGIVGKYVSDGFPIIVRLVPELPEKRLRAELKWLTVVSWQYDESANNGMPAPDTNEHMLKLEDALLGEVAAFRGWRHAYTRTGKGLKEFAFYIDDRDLFIGRLNRALAGQPRYPIEVNFYEDPEWNDFSELVSVFKGKR